jgi:hypothetical protein
VTHPGKAFLLAMSQDPDPTFQVPVVPDPGRILSFKPAELVLNFKCTYVMGLLQDLFFKRKDACDQRRIGPVIRK